MQGFRVLSETLERQDSECGSQSGHGLGQHPPQGCHALLHDSVMSPVAERQKRKCRRIGIRPQIFVVRAADAVIPPSTRTGSIEQQRFSVLDRIPHGGTRQPPLEEPDGDHRDRGRFDPAPHSRHPGPAPESHVQFDRISVGIQAQPHASPPRDQLPGMAEQPRPPGYGAVPQFRLRAGCQSEHGDSRARPGLRDALRHGPCPVLELPQCQPLHRPVPGIRGGRDGIRLPLHRIERLQSPRRRLGSGLARCRE